MTPTIADHVLQAAAFLERHRHHLELDHPAMAIAAHTVRAAGVWSFAELGISIAQTEPTVRLVMHSRFCAGNRDKLIYRVIAADDQEIGTAVCWLSKSLWPWGLTIPAANVVSFGFKSQSGLLAAAERFVATGSL